VASCAHVISRDLRDQADPFLTVPQALNNPTEYKGKIVIWGGEILRTENRQDSSTEIEVLQRALDRWEEPKDPSASEGRFLVREQSFLDPSIFRPGMRITVGGELQGVEAVPPWADGILVPSRAGQTALPLAPFRLSLLLLLLPALLLLLPVRIFLFLGRILRWRRVLSRPSRAPGRRRLGWPRGKTQVNYSR
jgi:hypothetical protein